MEVSQFDNQLSFNFKIRQRSSRWHLTTHLFYTHLSTQLGPLLELTLIIKQDNLPLLLLLSLWEATHHCHCHSHHPRHPFQTRPSSHSKSLNAVTGKYQHGRGLCGWIVFVRHVHYGPAQCTHRHRGHCQIWCGTLSGHIGQWEGQDVCTLWHGWLSD